MSAGQVPHYMNISSPNLAMMGHQSVPKAPGFPMNTPALDESKSGKKTANTDSAKKKPAKKAKKPAASKGGKQGSKSSTPPKPAGEPKAVTKPGQMRMRLRNTKTGHIVGGFAAPMRKHLHKYLSTHPHMRQLLPHEMAASNASGHGRRAGCCCCCGAETARRTAPPKSKTNSKAKQAEEKASSSTAKVKVEKTVAPKVKPEPPIWKKNVLEKFSPAAPGPVAPGPAAPGEEDRG